MRISRHLLLLKPCGKHSAQPIVAVKILFGEIGKASGRRSGKRKAVMGTWQE